jgi:recombination protein RecA
MSKHPAEEMLKAVTAVLKKRDIDITYLGDPEIGARIKNWIPTSSRILNHILGGGIPCGRITEIYGEEASGKSSIAADIMANVQKLGGTAVIIDSENVFSPDRAATMGVDVQKIIYSDAAAIEDVFAVIETVLQTISDSKEKFVLIWDSLASSTTLSELKGEFGKETAMAEKARFLSKGLNKIRPQVGENTALIILNQVRQKFGVMFGDNTESPGGSALRFNASLRVKLHRIGKVVKDEKTIGIRFRAHTIKNKVVAPFKNAECEMYFAGGIDDSNTMLDLMVKSEAISQSGSWYQFTIPDLAGKKFMRKDFKGLLDEMEEKNPSTLKQILGPALANL